MYNIPDHDFLPSKIKQEQKRGGETIFPSFFGSHNLLKRYQDLSQSKNLNDEFFIQ
jgi:hypothetical protein